MALWNKKEEVSIEMNLSALKKSKVPILVLDKNWHYMFPPGMKTKKMLNLENKLNSLLKEQGRLTNEQKDYKMFKKECMNQIIESMEEVSDSNNESDSSKNMSKSQKYIEEINVKLDDIEERLYFLPKEIKEVNEQLLEESICMSYRQMKSNKDRIKQLDREINNLREKLKDRIDEKNVKEEIIDRTYLFLHNLVGADVINKIDKENMEAD